MNRNRRRALDGLLDGAAVAGLVVVVSAMVLIALTLRVVVATLVGVARAASLTPDARGATFYTAGVHAVRPTHDTQYS